MNKRLHLYYSGSVQGVGFRFTAERIAVSMGIKGWVMNLMDGRVEAVCEAGESALKEFMDRLGGVFGEYIRDVDATWTGATGEFEGFDIRF